MEIAKSRNGPLTVRGPQDSPDQSRIRTETSGSECHEGVTRIRTRRGGKKRITVEKHDYMKHCMSDSEELIFVITICIFPSLYFYSLSLNLLFKRKYLNLIIGPGQW